MYRLSTDDAPFEISETSDVKVKRRPSSFKPILPPILREKDKELLANVRSYIDKEKNRVLTPENEYDAKRFAIYSEAFNRIIDHVTVYKEILADVKHEHDDFINTIQNGQQDSCFLQNKIKTLINLPTVIAGYARRKSDLEEKLDILNSDNERLQNQLSLLRTRDEKSDTVEENEEKEESPTKRYEERRPIPGLTVEEWTDEDLLKASVDHLNEIIKDIMKKQKTTYVPMNKKSETEKLLKERMKVRNEMFEEGKKMRNRNLKSKVAVDTLNAFLKKKLDDPTFDGDLADNLMRVLSRNKLLERQTSVLFDGSQFGFDEDDPSKEKEAEMILEYIDKFNELFNDEEYEKAAAHAANSPHGILKCMETLIRFRDVSLNTEDSPSPLLLFAEALMHSASAQKNVVDKEMTIICCRAALDENRPELIEHWLAKGCIAPCDQVAFSLIEYSKIHTQYNAICLAMAEDIFSVTSNHMNVCMTLYKMNKMISLMDYAKNVAKFTKNEYLTLIKKCPDSLLVWSCCRPTDEELANKVIAEMSPFYISNVLPLRFDEVMRTLIDSKEETSWKVAHRIIEDLYTQCWIVGRSGRNNPNTLHRIVYYETDCDVEDNNVSDWMEVANFCDNQGMTECAIEIRAAIAVKLSIEKALKLIAEDEKEAFDYYT